MITSKRAVRAANKNRTRPRECSCSMFRRDPPGRGDFWILKMSFGPCSKNLATPQTSKKRTQIGVVTRGVQLTTRRCARSRHRSPPLAKLAAFFRKWMSGCAKASTELFRGEFWAARSRRVTRISEALAQGAALASGLSRAERHDNTSSNRCAPTRLAHSFFHREPIGRSARES
jgi:hypothetical protein